MMLGMLRAGARSRCRRGRGVVQRRARPAPLYRRRARAARAEPRRRTAAVAGDYPEWLDGPVFRRVFGEERADEGAALARVRRSTCASIRSRPTRRGGGRGDRGSRPQPTRWSPVGLRIAPGRCQEPGDPCRARLPQGPDRDPGRGLADSPRYARRQAGRAGDRSLCRCRRQDAGACGRDGGPRADLCDRQRQAPARADPCPHRARRHARHPGAHAERAGGRARAIWQAAPTLF